MTTSIVAGAVGQEATIVGGNDGTLTLISGAVGSKVNAITIDGAGAVHTISSINAGGNLTVAGKISQTTPHSMVRLNTANGYGSTNTKIRRFTNVVTNQGTDITYNGSPADIGAAFTINTNGVYAISYSDQFSSAGDFGLSLNSTQLTTNIIGITVADILASGYINQANVNLTLSTTVYCAAGAIIRAHTGGVSSGTSTTGCQFTITRVA